MAGTLQLLAVSSLICECEKLAASGDLTEHAEISLRYRIASVLSAFNLPAQFDRPAVVIPLRPTGAPQ